MQKKITARTFAQESGPISRPQIHGSQLKLLYAHHSLAQPHKASREVYSVRRMKVSFGEDLNRKRLKEKRRKEKAMSRPWLASSPWPSGAVSNEAGSQQLQRTYRALFGGTAGRRAAGCGGREGSTDTGVERLMRTHGFGGSRPKAPLACAQAMATVGVRTGSDKVHKINRVALTG